MKRPVKLKAAEDFVTLLANLLANGFALQESFAFMHQVLPKERAVLALLAEELGRGRLFYDCLSLVGLAPLYVAQLRLAEVHGDLIGTLQGIGEQLQSRRKQKNDVMRISAYPILLLLFLLVMMTLMRQILLPQLGDLTSAGGEMNLGLMIIEHGPPVLFALLLGGALASLVLKFVFRRQSAIRQSTFLARLPLLKIFFKYYYTAFFASEWGKLLRQGLEMKQVLSVMQGAGSTPLMNEIAGVLTAELSQGQAIYHQISRWSFFQVELSLIIQQGEATGRLGDELLIYSQRLKEGLSQKMTRLLAWIQPLVFLFVALLIILVYSGLLLPIYGGMEDLL